MSTAAILSLSQRLKLVNQRFSAEASKTALPPSLRVSPRVYGAGHVCGHLYHAIEACGLRQMGGRRRSVIDRFASLRCRLLGSANTLLAS